ncbi:MULTISPECIES: glycoside hydrolase family 127 protein [Asticcacaulis]|uniref:glycoside hydrolase family 127 protein n=1 Tax=Asticcacaulis TaxID=76890 RepID=UPI001AEB724B|nr:MULTISPECIES: glycoside hydrolase family 127 protein [Asticcacaulis]MBP2161699.1 DUF1680 family protein [Asticcacaulis solisilvae]MDR6802789.1 DUF1680 family protein [Asticcacaulis sp. BE141]
MIRIDKRQFLLSGAALSLLPAVNVQAAPARPKVEPFPLEAVTLTPSIWQTAVTTNSKYLKTLSPERLLHNFYVSAGLPPKGAVYGGWENMGIAGHTLGHYLTACSLAYGQTRDPDFKARVDHTVAEMAVIQAKHGDGYIGGTTVDRGGKMVDGKIIYEEIRAKKLTSNGFDLNGGWVPIYTWHKVHAGLLDAHRYCNNAQALDVAVKMSDYLIGVLGPLDDAQMQQVLAAEHGGLNESLAETYARTGEKRFLDLSRRIYHKAILTPLSERRDELQGKHANTQIPKLIGLARLYELTGDTGYRDTASFFWDRVVHHHAYVIGGNSEGEHFGAPDTLSQRITDKTCEACNTYNMLKLTRHLYGWQPDAKWFDYYERAHLNHIMAHQDPETGMFVYFMPLYSGSERVYSTPENSFWCCVGSGIESHAKHGDSVWWRSGDTAFVNLFIPSEVNWAEQKTKLKLETQFPQDETVTIRVTPQSARTFEIALRLPGWCDAPKLSVNGKAETILPRDGYARLRRKWKAGDTITLTLPQSVKIEALPDAPGIVSYIKGPMVMAADLGPSGTPDQPRAPVLVSDNPLGLINADLVVAAQPQPVALKPFYAQYHRRSAVYFPRFSPEQWKVEEAAYVKAEQERTALQARTIDVMRLGEMQPERDHGFETDIGEVTSRAGRAGRWIMWTSGKYFAFDMAVEPKGSVLQVTYWGQDVRKNFDIEVNGVKLLNEKLAFEPEAKFRTVEYALPAMASGKARIRFVTRGSDMAVFEARTLKLAESATKA